MFVVTGLHTKRRPPIVIDKFSEKQCVERPRLLPAESHSHRQLHTVKPSSPSSGQAARRVSVPRMIRNGSDNRRPPIKVPVWQPAPTRFRKFIPKPLILVERMKARQMLVESSPHVALEPRVALESLNRPMTAMAIPLLAHVTPTKHQTPTRSVRSSDSYSFSSVSVRISSRNDIVIGSGFGMMPRSVRPLSVVTLADSSSSTDTFVVDSPCWIKQASSKVPALVRAIDVANVHLEIGSDIGKKSLPDTGVPVLVDSVATGFMDRTCQSTDTFEPAMTSTPFGSNESDTNGVPSPTSFRKSTIHPGRPSEQTPGLSDSLEIVSPTSRVVYPFNAPKGAYIVKLPNSRSAVSLSNRTSLASFSSTAMSYSKPTNSGAPLARFVNAPKPALDFRRLSRRVVSPSPTLVLDGVFALPHASPPSSSPLPRKPLNGFPRPRKPTSRRPLSDISNVFAIAPLSLSISHSRLPTSSSGRSGPESPRSKLAHVLTAKVSPQTMTRTRRRGRVSSLVKGAGVHVSNDPRTQCEIEASRARRAVELGRRGGRALGGDGGGKATMEQMSLASVGMVAKLRARWETSAVGHCGGVDGCA